MILRYPGMARPAANMRRDRPLKCRTDDHGVIWDISMLYPSSMPASSDSAYQGGVNGLLTPATPVITGRTEPSANANWAIPGCLLEKLYQWAFSGFSTPQ